MRRRTGKRGWWVAAVLAAAGVAGAIAYLALRKRRGERARIWMQGGQQRRLPGPLRLRIMSLRTALSGMSKAAVMDALGPPVSAALPLSGASGAQSYLDANVWYYPLDVAREVALAISFAEGSVDQIECLTGPPG